VEIHFFVADMRSLWEVYQKQFDVVIACDNSIPHLLCDEEILKAFTEFYKCTKPDGCCIISVRDYELLDHGKNEKRMNPRTIHQSENGQIILFDIWNFNDDRYDLSTYVIEDSGESRCNARVIRGGKYYCVTIPKLKELLLQAGFKKVLINKSSFFQPLLIASNG
jgi:SAM-dependent methyltransferase